MSAEDFSHYIANTFFKSVPSIAAGFQLTNAENAIRERDAAIRQSERALLIDEAVKFIMNNAVSRNGVLIDYPWGTLKPPIDTRDVLADGLREYLFNITNFQTSEGV